MSDRYNDKPTVINTSSGSGSWAAAIIIAMLIAAGIWYVMASGSIPGSDQVNITVETPKVDAPVAPVEPAKPAVPATNP